MLPPFQFVYIVWGSHVNFFIEACLPSLFASHNIPSIYKIIPIKFRIYTSKDDESKIIQSGIYKYINEKYPEINWKIDNDFIDDLYSKKVKLNYQLSKKLSYDYVDNSYHRKIYNDCISHATEKVNRENSAILQIFPDVVYANGTINSVYKFACEGKRLIWGPSAYRTYGKNILSILQKEYRSGVCLSITSRELVKISLEYMLPNMLKTFWGNFDRKSFHWGILWTCNGQLIQRCFCMEPAYLYPENKDVKFIYKGLGIEGTDFYDKAVPDPSKVHYIGDSDDYFTLDLEDMETTIPQPLNFLPKKLLVPSSIEFALMLKNYVQGTHARNTFKTHVTYRWEAGNDNSKEEKLAFDFTRKVLLLVTILEKHPFLERILLITRKIEIKLLHKLSRLSQIIKKYVIEKLELLN
jgi:hypothetical protein